MNRTKLILIIVALIAMLLIVNTGDLFTASISSISPQDIKFEGKEGVSGNYYVITAYIGARLDGFIITLQKDKEIDIGNNQVVKNGNEIKVQINPISPTQTVGVQQGTQSQYISYRGVFGIGYTRTSPEYYKMSGNWLTTTKYDISTYKNGQVIYSQQIPVNYQNSQEVKIGDIYIENIGQLNNGYNTPTQDFVVVKSPTGKYHLWTESALQNMLDRNNDWIESYGWTGEYNWNWQWNKAIEFGTLPRDETPNDATVSYTTLNNKVNQIVLTLPISISSSTLLIYIPQSLAAGIITLKHASVGEITSLSGCPTLDEGSSGQLTVEVKNTGSADYIGINLASDNHDISGNTRVFFNENDEKSFTFSLTARGTLQDTTVPITLTIDGTSPTNGDTTRTLSCRINNIIGLTPTSTPPEPEPTQTQGNFEIIFKNWLSNPLLVLLIVLTAIIGITLYKKRKS